MARHFTLDEARQLLPRVETLIRQVVVLRREHERAGADLEEVARRVTMMGGMVVDRDHVLGRRARRDATALRLNEVIEEIHEVGCQVKDLEMGLVDFPTLYRGQTVCLCWKLGESDIAFWHGETEGFAGRKSIDAEFLANHRGDGVA